RLAEGSLLGSSLLRVYWARSPQRELTQATALEYTGLLVPNQDSPTRSVGTATSAPSPAPCTDAHHTGCRKRAETSRGIVACAPPSHGLRGTSGPAILPRACNGSVDCSVAIPQSAHCRLLCGSPRPTASAAQWL